MNNKIWDCIVVGAGISGVSFAHQLKQNNANVLIIEKNNIVGGRMCTRIAPDYPDYKRELGCHTCYNSYSHLIDLVRSVDLIEDIQPLDKGSYYIYNGRNIVSIISQLNFLGLLFHGVNLFWQKRDNKSVRQYFSSIVGTRNYDKLFTYLFRAVICQFPDNYPTSLFLKQRKDRDKSINKKFCFVKGMSQLSQAVIEKGQIDTLLESEVRYIMRDANGTYIVKTDKGDFTAKNVSIACDPSVASTLLADISTPISNLLAKINLSKLISINVLVDSSKIHLKKIAGLINTGDLFLSAVSGDLSGDNNLRTFSFHFSKDQTNELRLQTICRVLGINVKDILDIQYANHVLPALTIEDINIITSVKELLKKEKGMYLLGNYFYGLSLEDCIHRSIDEASRYQS